MSIASQPPPPPTVNPSPGTVGGLSPSEYRRRYLLLSRALVVLLGLDIVASLLRIYSNGAAISFVSALKRACGFSASLSCVATNSGALLSGSHATDLRQRATGWLSVGLFLATGIVWLVWQYRTYLLLRRLKPTRNFSFTPVSSVVWWFVPFANLLKPYRATSELWEEADEKGETSRLLTVWWLTYLLAGVLGRVLFWDSFDRVEQQARIGHLLFLYRANIVSETLFVVAAILAISIVVGISSRLLARPIVAFDRHVLEDVSDPTAQPVAEAQPLLPLFLKPALPLAVAALLAVAGVAAMVVANPPSPTSHVRSAVTRGSGGWTRYRDASNGFSIALPPGWERESAPSVALLVRTLQPTVASVVVAVQPVSAISLDLFWKGVFQGMRRHSDVKLVNTKSASTPAGPTRILTLDRIDKVEGRRFVLRQLAYVYLNGSRGFIVLFSVEKQHVGVIAHTFARVERSLRLS